MSRLLRLLRIVATARRFGLQEFLPAGRARWLLQCVSIAPSNVPRGVRLRAALEALGPIFVKFGQMLSTRRDLLPTDLADALARLQDQVPPFESALAIAQIESSLNQNIDEVFSTLEHTPVASASIAQVHLGVLVDGREVAVKVLRPGVEQAIARDIALLETAAWLLERLWQDGRRLRPREVVAEFAKHLEDELDLMREAANASQLRRNFKDANNLLVPEVYWDWCSQRVMVMERMRGVPVSQVQRLRDHGVDLSALARAGVEIFFTQVFRDGFFHADMHPGNIFVAVDGEQTGRYIALDFGIMGTLTSTDKNYLAQNFLAFFNRDYTRVAQAHLDAGWVPPGTRIDEFEAAIRAVCEPIFARPLKDIYFGRLLLRLFQTSRRFNVEIQPQLVLLQKTLLNIEGLGRELDPELDLWKTAKPYLARWTRDQIGWQGVWRNLKDEAPYWASSLPQLPRLVHRLVAENHAEKMQLAAAALHAQGERRNRWIAALVILLGLWLIAQVVVLVALVWY